MHSKLHVLIFISLFVTGCSVAIQTDFPSATPPHIITATLPPSPTPRPSETPPPPPQTPTNVPVPGTTSTQLNVRAEPSTVGEVLGIIASGQVVQIVGQDPGGNWWQILYETGAQGKGWITAQYVETVGRPEVPVIGGGRENPSAGNSATIIQQLNVRDGPGTNFNSIGILNAKDVVNLTGKNPDGTWLQIDFPDGPYGKGWVNAAFVKTDVLDALPIVSDTGDGPGISTPRDTPLPPTPTIVPAPTDFDSADAPLKTILFERVGTQTLIYNGDVSTPDGDAEDWIAFTPYDNIVFVNIQCSGNGSLFVNISGTEAGLACNEIEKAVAVKAGDMHLVHIEAGLSFGLLKYVNYILTIKASQ